MQSRENCRGRRVPEVKKLETNKQAKKSCGKNTRSSRRGDKGEEGNGGERRGKSGEKINGSFTKLTG